MHVRPQLRTGLGLIAAVALLAPAAPAAADPPFFHEHYEDSVTETIEECGLPIRLDTTFSGMVLIREARGSDGQAFLAQDNYSFRDVLTNTDNGEFLVITGNGTFKEKTATHLGGDIFEFTAMEVGRLFTIEDSDGNKVVEVVGRLGLRAIFDTLGDGEPGGELIEEEFTRLSGRFPDFDFCAVVTDLIG